MIKRIFIALFFSFLFLAPKSVMASAQTDYDYQLGQYRQNYSEFILLKRDFVANQTLDNQQKVIISARQTLIARDLAKAAYGRMFIDLIQAKNTSYAPLDPVLAELSAAVDYFQNQAMAAQSVVTPDDLKKLSTDYLKQSVIHDRSFRHAQVANKIAQLVRYQLDSKAFFDDILPKLPAEKPEQLTYRINKMPDLSDQINQKINTLADMIMPKEGDMNVENSSYFSDRTKLITEIRALQIQLINQLIDIDINYVQL